MLSLGWGHAIPMDDILNSVNGRINVQSFQVTDPDGNQILIDQHV